MRVSLSEYCDWNTNARRVDINNLTLYFSYETVIAFRNNGKLVVRENDWGPTTGKHLKAIDGGAKESRVPSEEFERLLELALGKIDD